jgi:lactoylglutathione lyase
MLRAAILTRSFGVGVRQTQARYLASTAASDRPFQVLGIQQVAIGALDKGPLAHLWCDLFGVKKIGDYQR